MQTNLDAALNLIAHGFFVFMAQGGDGPDAKHPHRSIGSWPNAATTSEFAVRESWAAFPSAMPAIACAPSGLVVFDADRHPGRADGVAAWEALVAKHGGFDAPTVRTGGGGKHTYFRIPPGMAPSDSPGSLPAGIDKKSKGYVIGAGARFPDGRVYTVVNGDLAHIPLLPDFVRDLAEGQPAAVVAAPQTASMAPLALPAPAATAGWPDPFRAINELALASLSALVPTIFGSAANYQSATGAYRVSSKALGRDLQEDLSLAPTGIMDFGVHDMGDARQGGRTAIDVVIEYGWAAGAREAALWLCERLGRDPASLGFDSPATIIAPLLARLDSGELYNSATGEIVEAAPIVSRKRLVATPYVRRDPRTVPPRQFLYGRHLIRQFVSATIAPGAAGKSSLICAEALALATGRDLLGEKVWGGQKRVWLWNGEDPADELARKIEATCLRYGILQEETEGRLFVDSGRDSPLIIATQVRLGFEIAVPVVADLIETIREHRIDVVMIDPFISSHRVGENDNSAIDAVVKEWAQIADATNCAIELVHHARKTNGAEVGVEDGRGASSLLAAARDARVLNTVTDEEAAKYGAENRFQHFRVESGKANLSARDGKPSWYRLASVSLDNGRDYWPEGDSIGVVERWEPGAADSISPLLGYSEAQLREIQDRIDHSEIGWRKDWRSPNWAGVAIADVLGVSITGKDGKLDRERARPVADVLQAMIAEGMLRTEIGTDARRVSREYLRRGALRGGAPAVGAGVPWNAAA